MVFTRFVEIGRVAMINYGPNAGKICTIINVVDGNEALVDGPFVETGVKRQVINFKRLTLTDIKVNVGLQATQKSLKKAFKEEDVMGQWKKSAMYLKRAKQAKRASLNDFERFQVMVARVKRGKAIKTKLRELRK